MKLLRLKYALKSGLLFIALWVFLGMTWQCDKITGKKEEQTVQKGIRESLKSSPWYDYEKDDYKEYDPRDLERFIEEDDDEESDWWEKLLRSFNVGLSASFLKVLLYLGIGVLVAAIIFFVVQLYLSRVRRLGDKQEKISKVKIIHEELIEQFMEPDISLEGDLVRTIKELLASGDHRRAIIYMFLYALVEIADRGLVELKSHYTAREYTRHLARRVEAGKGLVDVFQRLVSAFEIATYRQDTPEIDPHRLWADIQREIG